jgi:hypothetical protein
MPSVTEIQHHLRHQGLENENLAGIVASATSNGDDTHLVDFIADLARAPWFRAIVERWPMLGSEIWSSPEIMKAEPTVEEARAILIGKGASREAAVFGDIRLKPVQPAVLDWLEGRTWVTKTPTDMILPIAIGVLPLLGPDAFPEDEDRWAEMLQTLVLAMDVFCQDGQTPAELLDVSGMPSVLAIAVRGEDPSAMRRLDQREAAAVVHAAFGSEGDASIDSVERYFENRALADASYRIPMSMAGPKT